MKIIDLYSGIGGGSLGFKQAGFEPSFGCDTDIYAQLVFAHNFQLDSRHDAKIVKSGIMPHPEVLFASPPAKEMSEVGRLILEVQPRCILFEFPGRMMNKPITESRQMNLWGYKCWQAFLNAKDFGLAQDREMYYLIGFRKDVSTPFIAFPFPDATCRGKTLAGVLEAAPDPKLSLTEKQLETVKKQNEKNEAAGIGFRTKVLTPDDCAPTLPIQYHKSHQRGVLVDAGQGPRRLSVLECRRLMGFPDEYAMPISDTNAYRLLAQASCPPMIAAIAEEIKTWLTY